MAIWYAHSLWLNIRVRRNKMLVVPYVQFQPLSFVCVWCDDWCVCVCVCGGGGGGGGGIKATYLYICTDKLWHPTLRAVPIYHTHGRAMSAYNELFDEG